MTDQKNILEQPPTLYNKFDPLHGLEHREDNLCRDPLTPFGKENNGRPIVCFMDDPKKTNEFIAQLEEEKYQIRKDYDQIFSSKQEGETQYGSINHSSY